MSTYDIATLSSLIEQFEKLPGIGSKTAQRLAYYILKMPEAEAQKFADSIMLAKKNIQHCNICCNLTDKQTCSICNSISRDKSLICVVEDPRDVVAIDRTGEYNGTYHVLHGAISPLSGIGPDEIHIKELLKRIDNSTKDNPIKEIILATNPTVEGEATSMYISRLINPFGIKVTRLAYGIPVGGDLGYSDEITISRALEGRRPID